MIEIEKPTITKTVGEDGTYGKFVVEPLERGYGTTLGNCMRRILLSSLPGAAVTSVKIDGILHEFSTIPGVKEDVTEIILNLKKLAIRLSGDDTKRVIINAVGPKEVTAADIIGDSELEIFNPDLHIATLEDNAALVMEINLARGARIRFRRSEQDGQHAYIGHTGRFDIHSGQESQLRGGEYESRAGNGFRQAYA